MRFSTAFLTGWVLSQVDLTVARPGPACGPGQVQRQAVYIITNQDENIVLSFAIQDDGTLKAGSSIKTGGAGGASINAATGEPAATDPLASQSALTVAGSNLFAVNAGSNTITMFSIDKKDPTKLKMIGKPVKVPGEFPNTVAASMKNHVVCVGATGAKAGVSCASFSKSRGLGAMDKLRPFELGQSTPPAGPTNTVSHVFFSGDEKTLFATVKGDPGKDNVGFLAAFPAQPACRGGVGAKGTRSSPKDTLVLFGSSPIEGSSDVFVTDASFGAAVLSIDAKGQGTTKGRGVVDGQKATCWATISKATKTAFVTDVGVNRLVEMSVEDASIVNEIDLSQNKQTGMIDLRAAGEMVYALAPGNNVTEPAIIVVDAVEGEQVQALSIGSMGADGRVMGMSVFGA